MEEDIILVIQRKRWTAEEKLKEVRALAGKATKLPEGAKKNIPTFPGDFSEEKLGEFLEKLKESIRNPLRHKNRKLIEDSGIKVKGISEEIFDDSESIESITEDLKTVEGRIAKLIVEKEIINAWLREGTATTLGNLRKIIEAKGAFQRILESDIEKNLKDELLIKYIQQRDFMEEAEGIISQISFVKGFDIDAKYEGNLEAFQTNIRGLHAKLEKIVNEYKIAENELTPFVKGKSLSEADETLKKKIEEYSKKKAKLQEEYKMYSSTLKLLNIDVREEPKGLHDLAKVVEELKRESIKALGDQGFSILQFLKGEEEFPMEISQESMKKTLEILRPFFLKALKEEE